MNKNKLLHISLLLLGLLIYSEEKSISQTALFDSLKSSVDTMHGTSRVLYLQNAARLFTNTSLDKGLYFAEESKKHINDLGNDSLLAVNYNIIGNLYERSGLFFQAETNYNSALKIYEDLQDFNGKATETHNLGIIYKRRYDTIKSIDYFKQSLDARYETNNNRRIGDGLTTLGEIYQDFGDYDKSIPCLTKAIEYYSEEEVYRRKFECYAFLADNFLSIDPTKSLEWIREMERMFMLDTSGTNTDRYKIDFRLGQYHLRTGDYLESAKIFDRIDMNTISLNDEYKPIETLRELSYRLYGIGEIKRSLELSSAARNNKKLFDDQRISSTISEYKARLDFRSTEEEISRTEELNIAVLDRIHTERLLKYALFLILLLLTTAISILLINFLNLKRDQVAMRKRNAELREAYEKSVAYKESILRFRESKSVFFNILTDKLLIPFSDLTTRLTALSDHAKKSFIKHKFLDGLGEIYKLSISIEKSLKKILIWSKLQRRKYEVNSELININDYLHELLPEILRMAIRQNIKVSFDTDPGLIVVFDRKSLRSIIIALVQNSIDNSPERSEIIIRGKKAQNGGIISVTDFGSGIDPDIQKSIFDLKKKGVIKKDSDFKKLGLGLLMSKHLAEVNNSYISFESKVNKGTSFYLHIRKDNGREETDIQ